MQRIAPTTTTEAGAYLFYHGMISCARRKEKIQVENTSTTKTITAYELVFKPIDPWGNDMSPYGTGYRVTTISNVKPGTKQYSNRIYIDGRLEIEVLYCAVSKVKFSDGTIVEFSDDQLVYDGWDGPFK